MALLYKLIIYTGIAAILLMFGTFYTGLAGTDYEWHRNLAFAAVFFSAAHGLLILYKNYRVKHPRKPAVPVPVSKEIK